MPAILAPTDYARWLDPAGGGRRAALGVAASLYAERRWRPAAVSPWVNSPAHDDPRRAEAVAE